MSVLYSIQEIKEKLKPIFESEPVYRAVLFGSYASGEANENSDVDIVLDSHGELVSFDFYAVLEYIVQALDKEVDLFDVNEIRPNSPISEEIQEKGVVLFER